MQHQPPHCLIGLTYEGKVVRVGPLCPQHVLQRLQRGRHHIHDLHVVRAVGGTRCGEGNWWRAIGEACVRLRLLPMRLRAYGPGTD